jgi:hypothetical protein
MVKTSYGLDVSIEIERDIATDTASVIVHAPMYLKKRWVMPHCYKSSKFSDLKIINDSDFKTVMIKHYL